MGYLHACNYLHTRTRVCSILFFSVVHVYSCDVVVVDVLNPAFAAWVDSHAPVLSCN